MIEICILAVLIIFLGPQALVIVGLFAFFFAAFSAIWLAGRLLFHVLRKICAGLLTRIRNAR